MRCRTLVLVIAALPWDGRLGEASPGSWPVKKINDQVTAQVQIRRLSDLHWLHTVTLPPDRSGKHD